MKPTSGTYSPQLDHLRFLAAILVFFWHSLHSQGLLGDRFYPESIFVSWMEEGHTGVSLFMVLSGFLMFRIMDGKNISILPFYANRILRLGPLVLFWAILLIDLKARTLTDILLSFIPIGTATRGIDGYWSISVELTFYIFLPVLISELNAHDYEDEKITGWKKIKTLLTLL